jgi:hypothetical protein
VVSDVRMVTGWIAYAALAGYWMWIISSTTPQLRRGHRDRGRSTRILALRTAGVALTAFVVGMIHFWATNAVEVLAALSIGAVVGTVLRREYRGLVAAPRHRLNLSRRIDRRLRGSGTPPAHAARTTDGLSSR